MGYFLDFCGKHVIAHEKSERLQLFLEINCVKKGRARINVNGRLTQFRSILRCTLREGRRVCRTKRHQTLRFPRESVACTLKAISVPGGRLSGEKRFSGSRDAGREIQDQQEGVGGHGRLLDCIDKFTVLAMEGRSCRGSGEGCRAGRQSEQWEVPIAEIVSAIKLQSQS